MLCTLSCHNELTPDYFLTLTNNSNEAITGGWSTDPDRTTLAVFINPKESAWIKYGVEKPGSWRSVFRELETETITFYVFKGNLYEIRSGVYYIEEHPELVVLVRYDFTLQDLEQLEWNFSYPPSPEMKNIQMEPPYSHFILESQR